MFHEETHTGDSTGRPTPEKLISGFKIKIRLLFILSNNYLSIIIKNIGHYTNGA